MLKKQLDRRSRLSGFQDSKTLAVSFRPPPSGVSICATISSLAHPIYGLQVCKQWKMARSPKEHIESKSKIMGRGAKTASPIRKRPAGPRRTFHGHNLKHKDPTNIEAASV